jgi:hypothetical protein
MEFMHPLESSHETAPQGLKVGWVCVCASGLHEPVPGLGGQEGRGAGGSQEEQGARAAHLADRGGWL